MVRTVARKSLVDLLVFGRTCRPLTVEYEQQDDDTRAPTTPVSDEGEGTEG